MKPTLIILAAGHGRRLRPLTNDRPKCMVEIGSKPVVSWQVGIARKAGIENIMIVTGYLSERIDISGILYVYNGRHAETNMVESLFTARRFFGESIIVSYGDILYEEPVIEKMINEESPLAVAVDRKWQPYWEARFDNILSDAETLKLRADGSINEIGQRPNSLREIEGQYIGLCSFRGEGLKALIALYDKEKQAYLKGEKLISVDRNLDQLFMTDLIQGLIERGSFIKSVPVDGGWLEIDSLTDMKLAEQFTDFSSGDLRILR